MAKCPICFQEMLTADGCLEPYIYIPALKKSVKRIPVGGPGDLFEGEDSEFRCGDCNAKMGRYHHPGCDCEICPVCGEQAISCDCNGLLKEV